MRLYLAGMLAAAVGCDGGCDGGTGGTGGTGGAGGEGAANGAGGGGGGSACVGLSIPEQDHLLHVDVGGMPREAVIHLPPGYDATQPLPLVLGFHFFSGTPDLLMMLTDLDEAAEAGNVILALPTRRCPIMEVSA